MMTPREIALSICEPWLNGDPCEGCECHKVCTKLVERIETVIQSERDWLEAKAQSYKNFALALQSNAAETNFGNMAQAVDSKEADHIPDATKMVANVREDRTVGATIKDCLIVEPVAWSYTDARGRLVLVSTNTAPYEDAKPLYSAPPKREPLTDEQISEIFIFNGRDKETFARAIERAHGIGGEE